MPFILQQSKNLEEKEKDLENSKSTVSKLEIKSDKLQGEVEMYKAQQTRLENRIKDQLTELASVEKQLKSSRADNQTLFDKVTKDNHRIEEILTKNCERALENDSDDSDILLNIPGNFQYLNENNTSPSSSPRSPPSDLNILNPSSYRPPSIDFDILLPSSNKDSEKVTDSDTSPQLATSLPLENQDTRN